MTPSPTLLRQLAEMEARRTSRISGQCVGILSVG